MLFCEGSEEGLLGEDCFVEGGEFFHEGLHAVVEGLFEARVHCQSDCASQIELFGVGTLDIEC